MENNPANYEISLFRDAADGKRREYIEKHMLAIYGKISEERASNPEAWNAFTALARDAIDKRNEYGGDEKKIREHEAMLQAIKAHESHPYFPQIKALTDYWNALES